MWFNCSSIAATTIWKMKSLCILQMLHHYDSKCILFFFFLIINKVDIAPNPKHLWGEWTRLQTSPGTNQPCYTSTIKNLKLSKMNSTCSMKAWHRCVALLGPPGRLSIARPSEQREMWKLNSKRRLSKTRRLRMQQKIQLAAYADGLFFLQQNKIFKLQAVLTTTFYLRAFDWSLQTKRSAAMTLVPIAPPGGRGESNPDCSC